MYSGQGACPWNVRFPNFKPPSLGAGLQWYQPFTKESWCLHSVEGGTSGVGTIAPVALTSLWCLGHGSQACVDLSAGGKVTADRR